MDSQEDYKPTYGKLFNVLLVTWLYLIFFGVI